MELAKSLSDSLLHLHLDTDSAHVKSTQLNLKEENYRENYLGYVLPYLTTRELFDITTLNKEIEASSENEWKMRFTTKFGTLRYIPLSYRKIYALRCHFQRQVSSNASARVYLMNTNGDTTFFRIDSGKSIMCSRERAAVYNRCERMFDLSLRINRSIQEISALIGMVSLEEARDLLNEHINLMASVAALRGTLLFESELFQAFPAPVLLDSNALLRGTHSLEPIFRGVPLMMQMWVSIDGSLYRPLSIPQLLHTNTPTSIDSPALPAPREYTALRFHELAGMTIDIDDNSIRYNLQPDSVCLNTLASNAYLLYLFNPTPFRPLDWTYEAGLTIGAVTHVMSTQREGVFLHTGTSALRIFFSYGKLVEENAAPSAELTRSPLDIPCLAGEETFVFSVLATNRLSQERKLIVSQAMRIVLPPTTIRYGKLDRHAHLPNDTVLCYSFDVENKLQYIECAIGFEAFLHRLDVAKFLPSS